jgi:hypothetical protein
VTFVSSFVENALNGGEGAGSIASVAVLIKLDWWGRVDSITRRSVKCTLLYGCLLLFLSRYSEWKLFRLVVAVIRWCLPIAFQ